MKNIVKHLSRFVVVWAKPIISQVFAAIAIAWRWFRALSRRTEAAIGLPVLALLAWALWPSSQPPIVPAPAPVVASVASAAANIPFALYDPTEEGAPPEWSQDAAVGSREVRELVERIERLMREAQRLSTRAPAYQQQVEQILAVKPLLWQKLVDRRFKDPAVGALWFDVAKDEVGLLNGFERMASSFKDLFVFTIIGSRIEMAKVYLIGGRARVGDVMFINAASKFVDEKNAFLDRQEPKVAALIDKLRVELSEEVQAVQEAERRRAAQPVGPTTAPWAG